MAEAYAKSRGRLVAKMLAGSWRSTPPPPECSAAELEEIAPLLLRSGAAALGWRQVSQSGLRDTVTASELRQAYRSCILQNTVKQRTIERVIKLLRSAGIEPVLVKGWAVARLYPERGLRPYGDVDLCVRPEQFSEAEAAVKTLAQEQYEVDLHSGFAKFGGESVESIYARSELVRLGETDVRVPSAEDHLRILCIHMLREGAWRPLWLCDIAVAIESQGAGFDWDCCLSENRRQADWITCAIRAAHELLGADITDTPAARRNNSLPRWLIPTILKEWESRLPSMPQRHHAPMKYYLSYPAGILKGLRHRWPNTIEATVSVGGPFNEWPRLPFQLGNCALRVAQFAARLSKSLREQ